MKTTKEIYADVMQKDMVKTVIAKQYDCNSRFLCVRFASYGVIMQVAQDDVAVVNVRRSNGEGKAFRGTVNEDGSVTVPLTSWMSELAGTLKCDISIVGPDGSRLTSMDFPISVEPAVYSGDEISEDEHYDILISLITDVQNTEAEISASEAARVQAEEKRSAAETARAEAETERNTAEAKRVTAENKRIEAERNREYAEDYRQSNEAERLSAEAERNTAEGKRASAEADRASAEADRKLAENNRLSAEADRNTAESNRRLAEDNRAKAEALRAAAETQRANAEVDRNSNEGNRISAESARAEAENARAQAEQQRASAESNRQSAETARTEAETARAEAETARDTAETARAEAEESRTAELAKKADREEMLEKLCPHGEVESASASVTIPDGLGGTVLRDWFITGAEGGVGDLNSETGKYDIPVTVRGRNLFKPQSETANIEKYYGNITILPFHDGAVSITGTPMPGYFNYISFCYPCAFNNSAAGSNQVNDVIVPQGNSFVLSWERIRGMAAFDYIVLTDSNGGTHGVSPNYSKGYMIMSALDYDVCNIYFRFPHGNTKYTFNDVYRFQVTLGTEVLPFEPYKEPQTVTVSLDAPLGAGESIDKATAGIDIPLITTGTNIIDVGTTVAPEKVTIDYYKDINSVLNNITNAILSQGGNV